MGAGQACLALASRLALKNPAEMESGVFQLDGAEQARIETNVRAAFARWREHESSDLLERARKLAGDDKEVSALMEPYVGERYAIAGPGGPHRIVILSADAGAADAVGFDQRREEFRSHFNRPPDSPHLKGTLLALQAWFDTPSDTMSISVDDRDASLFECCALLNATPFAISRPNSKSNTSYMNGALARKGGELIKHLIEALRPNLIVSQGNLAWEALKPSYPKGLRWEALNQLGAVFVLPVAHPSARGKLSWDSASRRYFVETVRPGITEARKRR